MTHELSQNKSTNNKHLKLCNKFHIIKSSNILEVCGPVNLYGDLYVDHWAFAETEFSRLGILDLISDLSHTTKSSYSETGCVSAFRCCFVAQRSLRFLRYCRLLTTCTTKYDRFPTLSSHVL